MSLTIGVATSMGNAMPPAAGSLFLWHAATVSNATANIAFFILENVLEFLPSAAKGFVELYKVYERAAKCLYKIVLVGEQGALCIEHILELCQSLLV